MSNDGPFKDFAEGDIRRRKEYFNLLLPFYPEAVGTALSDEIELLMGTAEALDISLRNLWERCAAAKDSRTLVNEMRELRVQGLRFLLFLRTSKQLLKVLMRRLSTQAEMMALGTEITFLKMNKDFPEIDLVGRRLGSLPHDEERLTRAGEFKLAVEVLFLPLSSRIREEAFRAPPSKFDSMIRGLISRATQTIYKQQLVALSEVVWRVIQPAVVPLVVGFVVVYVVHSALELGGIHLLPFRFWFLMIFVAAYALEKLFEHFFEEWHLALYRRHCRRTAGRLYLAEIRARSALFGLMAIAESNLKIEGEQGAEPGETVSPT
jgi:hypothetical protein